MDVWGVDIFAVQSGSAYLPDDYAHSRAVIRNNLFKGAGLGTSGDAYYFNLSSEPLFNSVVEDNTFWKSAHASIKFTKNTHGTVVRNNLFDYTVNNGVTPKTTGVGDYLYQNVVRFFDGGGNSATDNTLKLPAAINQTADGWIQIQDGSSTASGNRVIH